MIRLPERTNMDIGRRRTTDRLEHVLPLTGMSGIHRCGYDIFQGNIPDIGKSSQAHRETVVRFIRRAGAQAQHMQFVEGDVLTIGGSALPIQPQSVGDAEQPVRVRESRACAAE